MITDSARWSHAHGNRVVPSSWQATLSIFVCQVSRDGLRQRQACVSVAWFETCGEF